MRLGRVADGGDLGHQLVVDVEAAGGVEHDDVVAAERRLLLGALGDGDGVLAGRRSAGCRRRPGCPRIASCSIAAGRRVSSEAISTRLPSRSLRRRASFAVVVVLPEPCRPTIRIGAGGESMRSAPGSPSPRSMSTSASWTILTTCWPGVTDFVTAWPRGLVGDRLDEVARDRERDVGLEQRDADLAQRRRDVLVGQRALAGERAEDAGEPVGKGLEHRAAALLETTIAPVGATR